MPSYKHPKSDIIISGYVREIKHKPSPKEIIQVITYFYNPNYSFNVYDFKGGLIKQNCESIYNNGDHVLYLEDHSGNLLVYDRYIKHINVGNKMKNFICSNGNNNSHGYMFNGNNELYSIYPYIDTNKEIEVIEVRIIEFMFDSTVVEICCGWIHSLFLTELGNVYGSGNNAFNQLTNKYDESKSCNIQKIIDIGNIVKIGSSWNTSFILNDSNNNH